MRGEKVDEGEIRSDEQGQDQIEDRRFDSIDEQLSSLIVVAVEKDEFRIFFARSYRRFRHLSQIMLSVLFQSDDDRMRFAQQRRTARETGEKLRPMFAEGRRIVGQGVFVDDRPIQIGFVKNESNQRVADVTIIPFDDVQIDVVANVADRRVRTTLRRVQMRQCQGRKFRPGEFLVFPRDEIRAFENFLVNLFELHRPINALRTQLA